MSITNTDLAAVNENLRDIRDYSEKLEALDSLKKFLDSKGAINKSIKETGVKTTAVGDKLKNVIQTFKTSLISTIKDSANKLDKTLNNILKEAKVGGKEVIAPKAEQKQADKTISAAITSPIETTKSAVVSESNQTPEFEAPTIVKALDAVANLQKENNKLFDKFIKTEQKSTQAKKTESLINKKPVPTENKEKKEKVVKPKFPFNFKQFMGGLGTILKGILNPVALIVAFITKSLPYILIAIAFLRGFWKGIGEELREKFSKIGKKIAIGVGIVFALFKGGPILIRVLALAYHALRVSFLIIEHAGKMLLLKIKMGHEAETFAEEKGVNIFKRGLELAKFVMEKIFMVFKYMLEIAKFVLAAGIAIVIVGLVVLLIAGIIIALAKFGSLFVDAIGKVVDIFVGIGKFVIDIFTAIPKMIIDGVLSLFGGLFEWIFGGKSSEGETTTAEQMNTKSEVSFSQELKNEFSTMLKEITAPLESINKAVKFIAVQSAMQNRIGFGMISPVNIRTIAAITSAVSEVWNNNEATATASDQLAKDPEAINTSINDKKVDIEDMKKDISDMKKSMSDLYLLMQSWHRESSGDNPYFMVGATRK